MDYFGEMQNYCADSTRKTCSVWTEKMGKPWSWVKKIMDYLVSFLIMITFAKNLDCECHY